MILEGSKSHNWNLGDQNRTILILRVKIVQLEPGKSKLYNRDTWGTKNTIKPYYLKSWLASKISKLHHCLRNDEEFNESGYACDIIRMVPLILSSNYLFIVASCSWYSLSVIYNNNVSITNQNSRETELRNGPSLHELFAFVKLDTYVVPRQVCMA